MNEALWNYSSYAVFFSSSILPIRNMKNVYFFSVCFFGFLANIYATGPVNSGCLEREKALALIETAENLLTKAGISFPSCKEDANTTDESECGKKKSLAYIEISKKLISDLRKNFPTCSKPIEKDDKIIDEEKDDKIVEEEKDDKIVEDLKRRDCSEILANGRNKSGVYTIWSEEPFSTGKSLQVYCDMETDKGGWTVIQRRGNFKVQQDFVKDWESYKNGFGNLREEFWLGNENIRVLCHKGCEIRFDLQDAKGEKGFALYQSFSLSGSNYRLSISGYKGNVGDSLWYNNNNDFLTKDKDNTDDKKAYRWGWWPSSRYFLSNLNGIYQPGKNDVGVVVWFEWRKSYVNLASTEMKIRPK